MPNNCEVCQERCDDGELTEQAKASRKRWGCDGDAERPIRVKDGKGWQEVKRCPYSQSVRVWGERLRFLVIAANQGVLPAAGGLLDQSAFFVDALGAYTEGVAQLQDELASKAERDAMHAKARATMSQIK